MNGEKFKTKVIREVAPPWNEIMDIAEKIRLAGNGEVIIKIHQKKISLWEYHIKRKDGDDQLETIPL
jgi:hypothetical protein